jgi:hypothetical protein
MRIASLAAPLFLVAIVASAAVSELGTDVEFVPQSQAAESSFGAGLVAIVLQWTDADHIKPTFVARSAEDFVRQYLRLPASIQEHGIWITLAERDRYSPEELALLRHLEGRCRQAKILTFVRTGRQTEKWQHVSGELPK